MNEKKVSVLAVDLGAESGRVMVVHFDGEGLEVEELHRFPNIHVDVRGTCHWDVLRLWSEIKTGIDKGIEFKPASLGVDTWGVDFGLLDSQGKLLGNPVHYRDPRTDGLMEAVFKIVPREEVFAQTGIQFMQLNTLYQMMSLVETNSVQLGQADTFLTIPDLLNYWLTGVEACEYTIATTTQMFNGANGEWAYGILERLGIPTHIFPEVVQPGTIMGEYEGIPVIAVACHDTGSAVAGVPASGADFAYISSGTWSLVGLESQAPIISEAVLAANITNEGGVYGTTRFLKNVPGLWIVQQCRKTWAEGGEAYSYPELVALAEAAPPLQTIVDVDHAAFLSPGDYPSLLVSLAEETHQPLPATKGEILRAVFESLALKYAFVLDDLISLSGQNVARLHIVGGGSQNQLLNQMAADAVGIPVKAGPVEATVIGNALVQLITLGEVADLNEGRELVGKMEQMTEYQPGGGSLWREAKDRYITLW